MDNHELSGVSVIVPTYNREQYIKECLDSILAQEYNGPLEIVVCDDGSTDKTLEIAESYGPPVVVLRKPEDCKDQGPASTRNRGIAASSQPLIGFLDSDDIFLPGHLKRLAEVLSTEPNLGLVFDEAQGMGREGNRRWLWKYHFNKGEHLHETMLVDSFVPTNAFVIRRSILDNVGGAFDPELRMGEDVDLWIRILEKYPYRFVLGLGSAAREHSQRTTKDVRTSYNNHFANLEKAIKRYPYKGSTIRKRKAVIYFKIGCVDIKEGKYAVGCVRLMYAAALDPTRTVKTLGNILKNVVLRRDK